MLKRREAGGSCAAMIQSASLDTVILCAHRSFDPFDVSTRNEEAMSCWIMMIYLMYFEVTFDVSK